VRTRKVHGNNWRQSGINTLKTTTPCNFYRRSRKRKLNYSTDSEDMPPLPPPMQALEIRLDDNDDYMPDCPWKQHGFDYDSPSSQYINRISLGGKDLNSV
jgi:hypothetical protein